MPQSKVVTINLTTKIQAGDECVRPAPPRLSEHRHNIDVIRFENGNPANGSAITVIPDSNARDIFQPVPLQQELNPGQHVDWLVKESVTQGSTGFTTDPPKCAGQDSGDIVINC